MKEKGTRKVGGAGKRKRKGERASAASVLPSFLPFHFRVCPFSIQRMYDGNPGEIDFGSS